jgi:hypothetical protein
MRVSYKASDYGAITKQEVRNVRKAIAGTATEVAKSLRTSGRAHIKTAGRFGAWAFSVRTKRDGDSRVVTAKASLVVEALETGRTLRGRPLLWIPIGSNKDVPPIGKYPGKLARVERKGRVPLLVPIGGGAPKYFGLPKVVMPKKLHLRAIGRRLASRVPFILSRNLAKQQVNRG